MNLKLLAFISIFSLSISTSMTLADEIVFVADEWCPYNCVPGTSEPGFVVEIAREIFEKKGHTVVYKILPWARSILFTKEGKVNGIIGVNHAEVPSFIFPSEMFMTTSNVFIVKKNSKIKNVTEKDIFEGKYTLGMINGYSYKEKFDKYVATRPKNVTQLYRNLPLKSLIPMLNRNRIDVALEEIHVWKYNAAKLGFNPDDYVSVGLLLAGKMYIAFSPNLKSSKEYAKILSDGIKEMRKNGRLKKILAKYYIKDFK